MTKRAGVPKLGASRHSWSVFEIRISDFFRRLSFVNRIFFTRLSKRTEAVSPGVKAADAAVITVVASGGSASLVRSHLGRAGEYFDAHLAQVFFDKVQERPELIRRQGVFRILVN